MRPGGQMNRETAKPVSEETVLDLYRHHGARLYAYALGFLGEPADVEDVVQDAFVRLSEHLRRGGSDEQIRAWLYAVVANLCRDVLRWRKRRVDIDAEPETGPWEVSRTLAIRRVLKRLSPRDREMVLLRGGGLTYAEIAAAMGLHDASVGKLLSRALERFAVEYAREFGKEGA